MHISFVNSCLGGDFSAMDIARETKEGFDLPVILGGHHASMYPDEALSIPECDAVCIGDGEEALALYLDSVSSRRSVSGITGIWAKENGAIMKNSRGSFRENLDD